MQLIRTRKKPSIDSGKLISISSIPVHLGRPWEKLLRCSGHRSTSWTRDVRTVSKRKQSNVARVMLMKLATMRKRDEGSVGGFVSSGEPYTQTNLKMKNTEDTRLVEWRLGAVGFVLTGVDFQVSVWLSLQAGKKWNVMLRLWRAGQV